MLQRTQSAVFLGGAYVFPGGSLDEWDADPRILKRIRGETSVPPTPYWVSGSTGVLRGSRGVVSFWKESKPIAANRAEGLMQYRKRPFVELLENEDLYHPGARPRLLRPLGHRAGRPRRFDTRFFLAVAPRARPARTTPPETVHDVWITPREALERSARNEIELVSATQHTLQDLKGFATAQQAFDAVRARPEPEVNRACWAQGKEGAKLFRRADPAYFEIHWSDPEETGESSYDLAPGVPKRLDRYVTRIIAPNPGVMTGPGTNTYLVGEKDLAVIDPGPAIASHRGKDSEAGKAGSDGSCARTPTRTIRPPPRR